MNRQRSVKKSGHLTISLNTQYSGFGSLKDPLVSAGVTSIGSDGPIRIGEAIYRAGKSEVAGFPSAEKADYEVRVVLTPPKTNP